MCIRNHFEINENRGTIYQYFMDATKVRRTFTAPNTYIRKEEERAQIDDLTFHRKKPGKNHNYSPH